MTPADRLIVALDSDDAREMMSLAQRLYSEVGITFFKVGVSALMNVRGLSLCCAVAPNLFLDLKLYDTRDTVERTVKHAFDLGARFVTVHATPSVMEAAMRAKPADDRCKVLAVPTLTDRNMNLAPMIERINTARAAGIDGIICPVDLVAAIKSDYPTLTTICPGIRPANIPADNHMWVATPSVAVHRGADYLVVGRPIYQATDPVAVARQIIAEIA